MKNIATQIFYEDQNYQIFKLLAATDWLGGFDFFSFGRAEFKFRPGRFLGRFFKKIGARRGIRNFGGLNFPGFSGL